MVQASHDIDALYTAWADAFRRKDVDAIMRLVTPDYVLLRPGAAPMTADAIRPALVAVFASFDMSWPSSVKNGSCPASWRSSRDGMYRRFGLAAAAMSGRSASTSRCSCDAAPTASGDSHAAWWCTGVMLRPGAVDEFETERLRAERLQPHHLDELRRMHCDATVMTHLGGVRSAEQTASYLEKNLKHWADYGFGLWILRERGGVEWIGRGLLRTLPLDGVNEVETGYAFYEPFWNRGLATEIPAACLKSRASGSASTR